MNLEGERRLNKLLALGALLMAVCAAVWIFYPTTVPSVLYVADGMSDEHFIALKKEIIGFAESRSSSGLSAGGDDSSYGTISLDCDRFPVLVLSQDPGATTTLMVFENMIKPSSSVNGLVTRLVAKMGRIREKHVPLPEDQPNEVDRFFLKYRDDTDMTKKCR
ncbi:hypothetical protein [Arenimonas sp.]|uniref:hypothetical protein n=1 Tax=Arenimonas sp. TaxID=1872635 RepID=UPI0039E5F64D